MKIMLTCNILIFRFSYFVPTTFFVFAAVSFSKLLARPKSEIFVFICFPVEYYQLIDLYVLLGHIIIFHDRILIDIRLGCSMHTRFSHIHEFSFCQTRHGRLVDLLCWAQVNSNTDIELLIYMFSFLD